MSTSIKDFVRDALLQIVGGVDEAREQTDVSIAPSVVEGELQTDASQVRFELSITTSKEVEGGLKVMSLADFGGAARFESLNRVSFDVPVWFHGRKIGKD